MNKADDWSKRDFSITGAGALAYFSAKEKKDLIYYTAQDMRLARIRILKEEECTGRPFVFELTRPPRDRMEFDPGYFATDSKEELQAWVKVIKETQDMRTKRVNPTGRPGSPRLSPRK